MFSISPSTSYSGSGSHPDSELTPSSSASLSSSHDTRSLQTATASPPASKRSRLIGTLKTLKNRVIKQLPSQRRSQLRRDIHARENTKLQDLQKHLASADIRTNPAEFLRLLDKTGQQLNYLEQINQDAEKRGDVQYINTVEDVRATLLLCKDNAESYMVDVLNTLAITASQTTSIEHPTRLSAAGRLLKQLTEIYERLDWDPNSAAMINAKQAFMLTKTIADNYLRGLTSTVDHTDPIEHINRFCRASKYLVQLSQAYQDMGEDQHSQTMEWAKEILTYNKGQTLTDLEILMGALQTPDIDPAGYVIRLSQIGQSLASLVTLCNEIKKVPGMNWEQHIHALQEIITFLGTKRDQINNHIWKLVDDLHHAGPDPIDYLVRYSSLELQLPKLVQFYEDIGWSRRSYTMVWAQECLTSHAIFTRLVNNVYELLDYQALFSAVLRGDLGDVLHYLRNMQTQLNTLEAHGVVLNHAYFLRYYLSELPMSANYTDQLQTLYNILDSETAADALCTERKQAELLRVCTRDELRMRQP